MKRFRNKEAHQNLVNKEVSLVWLRRDLRLEDHAAFFHALKNEEQVLPLFIFDTRILDDLEDRDDARVNFILSSLQTLKERLETLGSSLLIWHGDPIGFFEEFTPKSVYTNHDYEPYARDRDQEVAAILEQKGIPFKTFKDQVIFEKDEVVKDDGKPYTVFTPYSRKWKNKLTRFYYQSYDALTNQAHLLQVGPLPFPGIEELGFEATSIPFPERKVSLSTIKSYKEKRNFPAINGTTRLSVHLRFGTISIRKLVQIALEQKSESWLNELIWRDFYAMILWHFPIVEEKAFKPGYNHIQWRNNEKEFEAWCNGATGYPIVDAGMRELNSTGFMHNRVRMITASFLVKHLLIDWRWGEAYFARKLLDFDLASNNGGWQWAAGSGCDAAPYFRVFNPELQTQKFDKDLKYIHKWIPDFNSDQYPGPIVNHKEARQRALDVYKKALAK